MADRIIKAAGVAKVGPKQLKQIARSPRDHPCCWVTIINNEITAWLIASNVERIAATLQSIGRGDLAMKLRTMELPKPGRYTVATEGRKKAHLLLLGAM